MCPVVSGRGNVIFGTSLKDVVYLDMLGVEGIRIGPFPPNSMAQQHKHPHPPSFAWAGPPPLLPSETNPPLWAFRPKRVQTSWV